MNNREFRRIYIRHADKEYANGDASMYKHDPGIMSSSIGKIKLVAKNLIEQWGPPNIIITSPYRRTRETANILASELDEDIQVCVDNDVAEYLGNHRNVPIDVTESTLVFEPPHPELFTQMKNRVKVHHNKITNYSAKIKKGNIWIITHGLIMKQVAALVGIKMPKEFPTLTCLSIVDGENMIKGELIFFNDNPVPIDDDNSGSDSDDN